MPNFAYLLGNTGLKINLSLISKGDGVDENGNLIYDDVEGMPLAEAVKLRSMYPDNVGTILVGKNDKHIIAAMKSPLIDFIIPFHRSQWKKSLYEALGLSGYKDYTSSQNESYIEKRTNAKGKKIRPVNFMPNEYWDFSKTGDENAQTYLKMCADDGRVPKFQQFSTYPGYWKLLIDFKMYDNDGTGSRQMPVRPEFNMEEARRMLAEYKGGHQTLPVAQDVVDEFAKIKKSQPFSLRTGHRTAVQGLEKVRKRGWLFEDVSRNRGGL